METAPKPETDGRFGVRAVLEGLKKKSGMGWRRALASIRRFAYQAPRAPSGGARPRIGVALGGGFAYGLAHLGVLKVLEENRFPMDALAGTSVGSVVAAAVASGCPLAELEAEARHIRWRSFSRWTVSKLGLASNDRMEEMLERVLRARRFEELRIPLVVVAADLATGEALHFRTGELFPPLRASCSFPGLFVPVEYQGRMLVDGAVVSGVPVEALAELQVERIVAVHLKTRGPRPAPANIFQVVEQAFEIAAGRNHSAWRKRADVVIEPDVSRFRWDDFGQAEELIEAGESAARAQLRALRALAAPRPLPAPEPLAAGSP